MVKREIKAQCTVIACVAALHLAAITGLYMASSVLPMPVVGKIRVEQFILPAPPSIEPRNTPAPRAAESVQSPPALKKPEVTSPPKRPVTPTHAAKPAPVKIPPQPSKELVRDENAAKRRELLAKAQAALADFDGTKNTLSAPMPPHHNPIATATSLSLPSDTEASSSYRSLLAAQLQRQLSLPEYGAATIQLTVDSSGKLIQFAIAEATTEAIRSYLARSLPLLSFTPPPDKKVNHVEIALIAK